MRKHKLWKDIAFLLSILLLVLVMLYSGLRILESTVLRPEHGGTEHFVSKTIERDGVEYFPRQDLTTVLVLGVDQFGPVEDSGSYQNRGASDLNVILIFDETNKVCNILHLNRDTMMDVTVLGLKGRPAGTSYEQLALAHTYGSGLEDSCENVVDTVSRFLYGIDIDYYVSVNMDAVAIANDAVGGVTVNVTEDFSQVDPTLKSGEITLTGEQAMTYVRTRKGVGDQLNTSRIQRHQKYLNGFYEALGKTVETDVSPILEAYEQVKPYMVTDCSANALSGMIDRYSGYALGEVVTPKGENLRGEEFMEFYVDEEKLDELILRLFYEPKE